MTQRSLYLAAYDVRNPKRLRAALKVLKDYALGGQKSVFECYLTMRERRELLQRLEGVLNLDADRFFLLRLDPRMQVETLGIGVVPHDDDSFYLG